MEDVHPPAAPKPPRKAAAKATPPTPTPASLARRQPAAAAAPAPTRVTADAAPTPKQRKASKDAPPRDAKPGKASRKATPAKEAPAKAAPVRDAALKDTAPKDTAPKVTRSRATGDTVKADTPTGKTKVGKQRSESPAPAEIAAAPEPKPEAQPAAEPLAPAPPVLVAPALPVQVAPALPVLEEEPAPPATATIPLWARITAEPVYTPEHLAREAVNRLGPTARDWAAAMRARYPDATADGLARLATSQFTRRARRNGAATGISGPLGTLASAGVLALDQASLVLHVAAAYGEDPTSPNRAADLLLLLKVPRRSEPLLSALANASRLASGYGLRSLAARVLPFGAAVAGAVVGGRGTADVAERAVFHYRSAR